MLQAIFAGHGRFVGVALFLVTAVTAAAFVWARRRHRPRPWAVAGLAGSVSAVVLLTLWGSGSRYVGHCTINRQISDAFLNDQGLLNVALFVPLGLFGVMVLLRPAAVVAGAAALSLTIEVAQATVPLVARTCDSSDWVANSSGALIGTLAGWALLAVATRSRIPVWHGDPRPVVWTLTGVLAVNAAVGLLAITPDFRDATSVQYGNSAMREAVARRVHEALGNGPRIRNVQYVPGGRFVAAGVGNGSITMPWPDNGEFTMSFPGYQKGISASSVGSVPIADGLRAPKSERDAREIATRYVSRRFPWALAGSEVDSGPAADGVLGWNISWRRKVHGILMPMRLDVGVDPLGRLSQLLVREIPDPAPALPTLDEDRARDVVRHDADIPAEVTVGKGTLALVRSDETWHTVWLFPTGVDGQAGSVVAVDAVTGRMIRPEEEG